MAGPYPTTYRTTPSIYLLSMKVMNIKMLDQHRGRPWEFWQQKHVKRFC